MPPLFAEHAQVQQLQQLHVQSSYRGSSCRRSSCRLSSCKDSSCRRYSCMHRSCRLSSCEGSSRRSRTFKLAQHWHMICKRTLSKYRWNLHSHSCLWWSKRPSCSRCCRRAGPLPRHPLRSEGVRATCFLRAADHFERSGSQQLAPPPPPPSVQPLNTWSGGTAQLDTPKADAHPGQQLIARLVCLHCWTCRLPLPLRLRPTFPGVPRSLS